MEFKLSCTRDFGRLLHHLEDPHFMKHGKMPAMYLFSGEINDLKWQL